MNDIAKIFLIVLSSSIFSSIVHGKCIDQTCSVASTYNTVIRFPFRVTDRNQPKDCGYPGFDVQCYSQSAKPVLELPNSVFFDVDSIDYSFQRITLSDPFECLPLKLFNLNLSTSPFYSKYYQEFAIFNCSGIYPTYQYNHTTNYDLNKVDCLSGVNHTVYAVETFGAISLLSSSCQRAANIVVPTDYYSSLFFYGTTTMTLYWDEPRCGPCAKIYRRCRVQSDDPAHEIECTSEIYPSIDARNVPNRTIGLAIGFPVLVVAVAGLMFWTRGRCQGDESAAAQSITTRLHTEEHTTAGLDQSTIESYPRVVIGESGRLIIPDDNTCPICLSEYQISQVLKILPECLHRFHDSCIDQWLVQKGTCPVCRVPPPRG